MNITEAVARQLLERYLAGETSLQEEQQLACYFKEEHIPQDLLPYRSLFRFFQAEAAILPPEAMPQKTTVSSPHTKILRIAAPLTAVAAAVLLFFVLHTPKSNEFVYYKNGQRINNQEKALQLAQKQLNQIALQTQKAANMMQKLEHIKTQTEKINKYISQ